MTGTQNRYTVAKRKHKALCGSENLSVKPDAEAVLLSPNHGTALHIAIPAQHKFLGRDYWILDIEHGASSGNIAHGAADDRAALVKDNFPGFELSMPVAASFVCDRFVLHHCTYCPRFISPSAPFPTALIHSSHRNSTDCADFRRSVSRYAASDVRAKNS